MDNYRFDITARDRLKEWIECCLAGKHYGIVGWSKHDDKKGKRLIFYWSDPNGVAEYHPLPSKVNAEEVSVLAESWLESVDYDPEPDIDGHSKKGFRIFNEDWGHVDGYWEALLAISPVWAMYGK